jgi:hypothetical protein
MRQQLIWALTAVALAFGVPAAAASSVDVDVRASGGPATVRVSYRTAPALAYVPEHRVYVVDDRRCDDDMFRYRDTWWLMRDGRWYRARHWRGPFSYVHAHRVPDAIWRVPERRWKRHPHAPGGDRGEVVLREKRGRGRGHDRER